MVKIQILDSESLDMATNILIEKSKVPFKFHDSTVELDKELFKLIKRNKNIKYKVIKEKKIKHQT